MSEREAPALGWTCPACGRRVPRKVATCRCGRACEEPPAGGNATDRAERAPSAGSAAVRSAALIVIALAAIVGVFAVKYGRPTPAAADLDTGGSTATRDSNRAPAVPADPRPDAEAFVPSDAVAQPDPAPLRTTRPESIPASAVEPAAPATAALEDLVGRVMPAVVTIQTNSARGSGFFVSPDTILTNVHVVESASGVTITRNDGTNATAIVQTSAPAFDIAVLKLSDTRPGQAFISLGTASSARPGQEVIAIGTPLGFLQNTVSRGIVSGLREVGGATLVQTDAAVNPGNSGGPLLDRNGVAIGIIKSGYAGRDGLAFAVAIDHARTVLDGRTAPALSASPAPPQFRVLSPAVASPADQRRLDGTRAYAQTLAQLARQADALDERWRTFRRSCYEGAVVGSFTHEWFALWDTRAMRGAVSPGCAPYFNDVLRMAHAIHDAVVDADEEARQADVYPGTRRDLLRKNRLDYSGWGR